MHDLVWRVVHEEEGWATLGSTFDDDADDDQWPFYPGAVTTGSISPRPRRLVHRLSKWQDTGGSDTANVDIDVSRQVCHTSGLVTRPMNKILSLARCRIINTNG